VVADDVAEEEEEVSFCVLRGVTVVDFTCVLRLISGAFFFPYILLML
jgi:hypothetical protein